MTNRKTSFGTDLDKAIAEVVKDEFALWMMLDSSGAYKDVKNEKLVESHRILAKEEDEEQVTVYVMRLVSCYGPGTEYDPQKHYGERGCFAGICSITFDKTATGYEKKEFWDPSMIPGENNNVMKAVREKLSKKVPELDLEESRYMPWMRTECHREALEYLKKSEEAGTKEEAKGFEKITGTVEKVDIFTPEITRMEVDSKTFIKKLVDAYNQMELVALSNRKENKMDVEQAITIDFYEKDSGKITQIIFDEGRSCWINGVHIPL